MKKGVCFICEREIEGYPIREDAVIQFIRWFKKQLGVVKGYQLVVCPDDLDKYKEKRKRFESLMLKMLFFSGIILLLGVFIPLVRLELDVIKVFASLLLAVLFPLLGVVIGYVPALEEDPDAGSKGGDKRQVKEKS